MCELPLDCLGVILTHVDEPTLRAVRLVSMEYCAAVAIAAKTRADAENVLFFNEHMVRRAPGVIIINIAPSWEIRLFGGRLMVSELQHYDRGVMRKIVERFSNYDTVYIPRIGLYVSRIAAPPCFCGRGGPQN